MIDLTGMVSIAFIKKSVFAGSYQGMRYQLGKKEEEEKGTVLEAVVWPEPFNYEHTAEEVKQRASFSFDPDGLKMAVEWLNRQYADQSYRPDAETD